jgi:hypothetical protein
MQPREKYIKIISGLLAAGAMGASSLLASAAPSAAAERAGLQSDPGQPRVSERLAAIREAVFVVLEPQGKIADPNIQRAWGNAFNHWGWRRGRGWRPRRNNWHNAWPRWNNWWRNW